MSGAKRVNRRRGALKTSDLAAAPTGSAVRDESPVESPRQLELPLLRPGQSIVSALKETTYGMSDRLDRHFAGWTPSRDLAAQVHQKQQLEQDRKEKGLASEQPGSAPGTASGASAKLPTDEADLKKDEVQQLIDKAGEPGSIFWSPGILKSHITDMLQQLHTGEVEELLGEQIEMLRGVVGRNSNLVRWLNNHDRDTKELHDSVKHVVEGLEQRVDKTGRKTETTLYGCQDMGERMVGLINAAFAERERVRQLLLADADIVVTEEKKALLEERRRIGQEMANKVRIMKQLEEEIGPGGIPEPAEIANLRMKIEKKMKKQAKLKAEQEAFQHRLKPLEQALQAVERGERQEKINALDQRALETLEEAKGMARRAAIAPLLEAMKQERGLQSPEPYEMPPELTAERVELEEQLLEVEAEIQAIEDLRVDLEGMRAAAKTTVQHIPDEAEKRLSVFSAKRRQSYLPARVEPPVVAPMPPFAVEKALNIKAGLRKRCREMHAEMEPLMQLLPRYLALVKNAEQTAKAICEQREKFIIHLKFIKPKFLKDLRYGGVRKMGRKDINAQIEEEEMMKEVEDLWDEEEAKLLAGHEELQVRARYFEHVAAEVAEEFAKLEDSVKRNRWSFDEKSRLEEVDEDEEETERKEIEVVDMTDAEEAEPMNVENFLTLQEDETVFVRNAITAYHMRDEELLARLAKEGAEVEKEAALKQQEELEKRKVMRDVHLSELSERRKSMVSHNSSMISDMSRSGSFFMPSRQGSKDTLALDSPTGSQGLASWNLSDGNKLSFARGSVRTQTMPIPRSTFFSSESIEVPSVEEDLSASTPASREASVERSPRPVVSRPASPTSPTASPKAKSKGGLLDRLSSQRSSVKKAKAAAGKKRASRRAHTMAAKTRASLNSSDCEQSGEETSRRPSRQERDDDSASDINVEASERLQQFLKVDRQNTRLEAKVRESSLRLSKMRFQLLGENASPLDLDRLKSLAGDDRARALAQDSVAELRQKWQERLDRGIPADEPVMQDPTERSATEENAFKETYAKLLAAMDASAEAVDAAG